MKTNASALQPCALALLAAVIFLTSTGCTTLNPAERSSPAYRHSAAYAAADSPRYIYHPTAAPADRMGPIRRSVNANGSARHPYYDNPILVALHLTGLLLLILFLTGAGSC